MERTDKLKKLGFVLLVLLLAAVLIYSGFRFLEATVFFDEEEVQGGAADGLSGGESGGRQTKSIEKDGVRYFPKQDMETFLFIGVDQEGPVEAREYYENSGMADAVMVVMLDKATEQMEVLSLNRDTMTQVPVIGLDGRPAGSVEAQLAVSYAYGDGLEASCQNTAKAVSDLLYGVQIDHYVAMNMDGIKVLNDAVGGVTVHVSDDFSKVDPEIAMGEMTLHGDQALTFIRARKDVGSQLNVSRMERQQEYMENFFLALREAAAADSTGEFTLNTFDALSPYIVTDCSATVLSSMMERYGSYGMGEVIVPAGENVRGEKYMEFYLDEEAFEEMVLDTFFVEIE